MRKRPYCSRCGENLFTEIQYDTWLQSNIGYNRHYTNEEDMDILNAYKKGYTYREISESLENRSIDGVRKKIYRMRKAGLIT